MLGSGQVPTAKNGQKPTLLMTPLPKKNETQNQTFSHCRLENLPGLLRVWTAV